MTGPRWTDATEKLVAEAYAETLGITADSWLCIDDARLILATLADAGLLIPPGSETVTEYRCPVGVGVHPHRCPDTTHVRTVHTGPWQEVAS